MIAFLLLSIRLNRFMYAPTDIDVAFLHISFIFLSYFIITKSIFLFLYMALVEDVTNYRVYVHKSYIIPLTISKTYPKGGFLLPTNGR